MRSRRRSRRSSCPRSARCARPTPRCCARRRCSCAVTILPRRSRRTRRRTGTATAAPAAGPTRYARDVRERARRATERRPSAWVTAHLNRAEGTLLIDAGRVEEGRTLLEAAAAAFVASGDRVGAACAHYGAAGIARLLGSADAEVRTLEATAELAAGGIPHPHWIDRALSRAAQALAAS